MGLFRKTKTEQASPPPDQALIDQAYDELGMVKLNQLNDAIGSAIAKHLDPSNLSDTDDTGGHFNVEFNLNTTVGRLKSLYRREPWVYATASLIARTLSTIPMKVRDPETQEILERHPMNDILNAGNQLQDCNSLKWAGYLDLALSGNFFSVISDDNKTVMHVPVEIAGLKLNDKFQMNEKNNNTPIEALEITGLAGGMGGSGKSVIPWKNVIHHKMPNPFNPFIGMSMYQAAGRPILLDRHKNEFEMAFYLRGATHAGVIETTEDITKQRMERLMRTFEQSFTGKRNWWRTLFLPKGAKWVNSGLTMAEMQHLDGLRENRLTLLAVLGIPPSAVGIVQDVNRATSEVQEGMFYNNTIVPMAQFVAAGWNNSWIVQSKFKGAIEVFPDLSGIDAIEGSIVTRGEQAQAVQDYLTVNEIRTDILGYPPLKETDPRGQMFVKEIKPPLTDPFSPPTQTDPDDVGPEEDVETTQVIVESGDNDHTHVAEIDETGSGTTISTEGGDEHVHDINLGEVGPGGDDDHTHPPIDIEAMAQDEQQEKFIANIKASAIGSQETAENSKGKEFQRVNDEHTEMLLSEAIRAIRKGVNVRVHLANSQVERMERYLELSTPVLESALERGYSIAASNTKTLGNGLAHIKQDGPRFTPEDQQALDIIKERTADGQRKQLAERSVRTFAGFDETKTENIMQVIEDGLAQGRTLEQVAGDIRTQYGERYRDQSFTITRTEVLSAISQGIQWEHETLSEVFSEVNKQWFHVGDAGSNPDAREQHAKFEKEGSKGIVPSNHVWVNDETGGRLRYPRDPNGGAADVINCRCTMVSQVPKTADSIADQIIGG